MFADSLEWNHFWVRQKIPMEVPLCFDKVLKHRNTFPFFFTGAAPCVIWRFGVSANSMLSTFYHAAVTKPLVCDPLGVGIHPLQKRFLFNHTTLFLTKGLENSLYDFTGTIFAAWVNPYEDDASQGRARRTHL